MKDKTFNHDHFNTWKICKRRYYYKYIKKLNWPDFNTDYDLGRKIHALIDYKLRKLEIRHLLENADNEIINCWEKIKDHQIFTQKAVKTEWGFNTRINNSDNWLLGRIDAIFFDPETRQYIIADWKTGKYIPKDDIEENFQHKTYLYALFNSKKDLKIDFCEENLVFKYIKITDNVSIKKINFSKEKKEEYEETFLNIIKSINNSKNYNVPEICPFKECNYNNLCV